MAKRGYKLQEFVAHSGNVNCLKIGRKACRLFITGGDDHKLHLWALGKPTSLMSLYGHTSPVGSLAFDSAEVLVAAGASTGMVKLWDLEEAKMVRTLTGHKSNCTAVEFHPFGEFFASGSMDTNLKIWDIRKKGCIHTYKGHTQGISTTKFTPDGRWVVSGGFDNVVKIWDLTAGKLLHDFKFHDGHIQAIDFHPLEFLLATGSADKTVKFWDLETFELIGSTRPEATGVRSISFHPDGKTLFCGLEDSFKVYSWEPVIRHDAVDMGWSTLGDLCIHDGKLLGCSYYQNSVGIWVADISLVEPYGAGTASQQNLRSTSDMRSVSMDDEMKEIKTIYMDSASGKPVGTQKDVSITLPKVEIQSDSKDDAQVKKQSPTVGRHFETNGQTTNRAFIVPNVVPQDIADGKNLSNPRRESITTARTISDMPLKPTHTRRPSNSKIDNRTSDLRHVEDSNFSSRLTADGAKDSSEENLSNIDSVTGKLEKILSPQSTSGENSIDCNKGVTSVKLVKGVAVVSGRTRSLVERFERRETFSSNEDSTVLSPHLIPEANSTSTMLKTHSQISAMELTQSQMLGREVLQPQTSGREVVQPSEEEVSQPLKSEKEVSQPLISEREEAQPQISGREVLQTQISEKEVKQPQISGREVVHRQKSGRESLQSQSLRRESVQPQISGREVRQPQISGRREIVQRQKSGRELMQRQKSGRELAQPQLWGRESVQPQISGREFTQSQLSGREFIQPRISRRELMRPLVYERELVQPQISGRELAQSHIAERDLAKVQPQLSEVVLAEAQSQISETESPYPTDEEVTETLMQNHDVFLSTLRSRLTKLQVVCHFWERNDVKGAISALRKLPDHSVQADVVSVLTEKMDALNLDLFSCLLPVLMGLLDSKTERHINVSLELLLKLVAVFGPVIRTTISARPTVGVDLHAEYRLQCCNQCFIQLQKIQKTLPVLIRRGGLLARSAQELNLVLES